MILFCFPVTIFAAELGVKSDKNVFNTFAQVRELYSFRRSKVESVNETMFQSLKRQYNELKTFLASMSDTTKTMKEVNELWESKKESINSLLNFTGSAKVQTMLDTTDFSSFSSSLKSGKQIVNVLFGQMVSTLGSYFGFEIEANFPATTALLYYLIWKNTDNVTLQYLLLIDILGTIGIVDVVLGGLRTIGGMMKKVWDKVVNVVSDQEMEKLMKEFEEETEEVIADSKEKLDMVPDSDEDEADLSIWDKIVYACTTNNFALIGVITLAIGAVMKLSVSDYSMSVVGKDVVTTMKNISIIGGGLAMIPKTYQVLISALKWVMDELKGKFCSNHVTKTEIAKRTVEWIVNIGPFTSDLCIKMFSKSPDIVTGKQIGRA